MNSVNARVVPAVSPVANRSSRRPQIFVFDRHGLLISDAHFGARLPEQVIASAVRDAFLVR